MDQPVGWDRCRIAALSHLKPNDRADVAGAIPAILRPRGADTVLRPFTQNQIGN